jgi:hypothetical protein
VLCGQPPLTSLIEVVLTRGGLCNERHGGRKSAFAGKPGVAPWVLTWIVIRTGNVRVRIEQAAA